MKQLLASINMQCSDWDVCHETDNIAKLRRNVHAENKFYSVCEDLTVSFDLNMKLINVVLSTPSSIMEEKMNDYDIKAMNKINFHHINSEGMKCIYEIVDFVNKIEKFNKVINLCETEQPNHSDVSSCLLTLAKIEDNNNRNELAVYCKFVSEHVIVTNTKFNMRVCPEDSFTIAFGLLLCNNSTIRHEKIRKSAPLILLPEKRTLFEIKKKEEILPDCFLMKTKQHFIAVFWKSSWGHLKT